MTDRSTIRVGDLVVISKACCHKVARKGLGIHATVRAFYMKPGYFCKWCDASIPALRADLDHPKVDAPVMYLKRIPPLDELEGKRTEEPLRQPTRERFAEMVNKVQEALKHG